VATFDAKVEIVEPAGSDTFVVTHVAGKELTARVRADRDVRVGENQVFAFDLLIGPIAGRQSELRRGTRTICLSVLQDGSSPAGACAIGARPGAVVTPDLKLRGIDGFRVVDASVTLRAVMQHERSDNPGRRKSLRHHPREVVAPQHEYLIYSTRNAQNVVRYVARL